MIVLEFIDNYLKEYNNYKSYWNYEDGCILMGCQQLYMATSDEKYLKFILEYLKDFINDDGSINNYETGKFNIDSINAGKVLYFAYDNTGQEKYRKAIEFLQEQLREHPRTQSGNFWHKLIYPNQIWLDGLYMAQPFYMEYETRFGNKEHYSDILNQFEKVRKYMYNSDKGLYYHAYDEMKIQLWADKTTGLSPNFWLRSIGWYVMALIDVIGNMSFEIFEIYKGLEIIFKEAIKGILNYQDDKSGLFYQIVDRSDVKDNYTETSGSAMVAYAIMKACRMGVLSKEKYEAAGKGILESLIRNKLKTKAGRTMLDGICQVAGLGPGEQRDGSVEYYLSEKVVSNDPKGVGPFMMAYAQYLMLS